ncbi:hypothetical protein M0638_18915 [Roseomonas sp. NAR14]|uniref:Uncharacterized protein n=1 Tax=Roseomonas acroporae TaxID=2937791 RepID=A0A9X1YHW1_9PROT|nr:hypothetical protein [Roseomonas acroporae]MCK8786451.1 hypothetical protein [Roseomonas acroporae]
MTTPPPLRNHSPRRLPAPARALLLALALLLARPALAEPVFPAGSAIGMEPPAGFAPATGFSGFAEAASGASIVFAQLPGAAFAQLRDGLTSERLLQQGIGEETRRTVTVGGREGLLVTGTQYLRGDPVAKWLLLLPGDGMTALVTVNLPGRPSAAQREAVDRALTTTVLRRPDAAAERAALRFAFAETPNLRFRMAMLGSAAMLAPDGAAPGGPAVPTMTLAASVDNQPLRGEPRTLAELGLRSLNGLVDMTVEEAPAETVAGQPATVLTARARDQRSGTAMRLIQWLVLPPGGGSFRALASAPEDRFEAMLPEFRQVVASVTLR